MFENRCARGSRRTEFCVATLISIGMNLFTLENENGKWNEEDKYKLLKSFDLLDWREERGQR